VNRVDAERRLRALRAEIRHHDYLYHVKDRPEISDGAYDALFGELRQLEAAFPDLVTPDSPTQRVGGGVFDRFPTVRHTAPMLSLDSDRDEDALRRFDERLRKALDGDPPRYVLEPKLDGASVELVYEQGGLVRAATRGDGVDGEGITDNIRTIATVPLRLAGRGAPPSQVALRGEVIMRLSAFEQLNERLMAEGQEPFANPRNAAAGTLRQLDPTITAQRPLDIYVYEILDIAGVAFTTHHEALEAIRGWGFPVSELIRDGSGVEDILAYHRELLEGRDDLDFEIDGVVIKLDDLAARTRVGSTARHPRWAYAFKFPPRKEVTRVIKIVASVGRTGVVTPIAIMRPVEIGGVTVSRATLHNREEVARKDIREGDLVRIQRAGDVIPQVLERVEDGGGERGPAFAMPDRCPSCGTRLQPRGPFTVCPNAFGCPAQLVGRIVHFAGRDALDITGLGEETARLLVRTGLVRRLDELFDLREEQLTVLEGFAEKSASNLIGALHASATADLSRVLFGLGIPEVGVAVARDLAEHFGTLEALRGATEVELLQVPGVGPKMAAHIAAFFRDRENATVLDRLLSKVRVEGGARKTGGSLAGLTFVFSGTLEAMSRSDAESLVSAHGARAATSVSKKTSYVVAGADPGSKVAKARAQGVAILDEAGFLALLRRHGLRD
jgi:DNA ligase (NAD+)